MRTGPSREPAVLEIAGLWPRGCELAPVVPIMPFVLVAAMQRQPGMIRKCREAQRLTNHARG